MTKLLLRRQTRYSKKSAGNQAMIRSGGGAFDSSGWSTPAARISLPLPDWMPASFPNCPDRCIGMNPYRPTTALRIEHPYHAKQVTPFRLRVVPAALLGFFGSIPLFWGLSWGTLALPDVFSDSSILGMLFRFYGCLVFIIPGTAWIMACVQTMRSKFAAACATALLGPLIAALMFFWA